MFPIRERFWSSSTNPSEAGIPGSFPFFRRPALWPHMLGTRTLRSSLVDRNPGEGAAAGAVAAGASATGIGADWAGALMASVVAASSAETVRRRRVSGPRIEGTPLGNE